MIAEDYVSYEVAKLLKEKGFDEPCLYYYKDGIYYKDGVLMFSPSLRGRNSYQTDTYSAPTHQMAMKWLREVYKVLIVIDAYHADHWEGYIDAFEISIYSHASTIIVPNEIAYHTNYEEAVDAALKYCLTELI